jgi:hypothetical protein
VSNPFTIMSVATSTPTTTPVVAASATVSLDPATPLPANVLITDPANNQYLGLPVLIFDVKAQGSPLVLKGVSASFQTSGSSTLGMAYLYQGSQQLSSVPIANVPGAVANFTGISLNIPVGASIPLMVKVDVKNIPQWGSVVSSSVNPIGVTLVDQNGKAIIPTGGAQGNQITVTPAAPAAVVTVSSMSTTHGTKTCDTTLANCNQTFSWTFTLQAGNNSIYLSKNVSTAISVSSVPSGILIVKQGFSDNNTTGDSAANFYIAPGQSKTFTAYFQASGPSSVVGSYYATALNYSLDAGLTQNASLSTSDVQNQLRVVLFSYAGSGQSYAAAPFSQNLSAAIWDAIDQYFAGH